MTASPAARRSRARSRRSCSRWPCWPPRMPPRWLGPTGGRAACVSPGTQSQDTKLTQRVVSTWLLAQRVASRLGWYLEFESRVTPGSSAGASRRQRRPVCCRAGSPPARSSRPTCTRPHWSADSAVVSSPLRQQEHEKVCVHACVCGGRRLAPLPRPQQVDAPFCREVVLGDVRRADPWVWAGHGSEVREGSADPKGQRSLAVDETVILLHPPPLPLVGVSI